MMNSIQVLGAGFCCIDIIHTDKSTLTSIGGTAANVISILSAMGISVSFIYPRYKNELGEWIENNLDERKVSIIPFTESRQSAPRIIEKLDIHTGYHCFFSICPICGKKLANVILPQKKQIDSKTLKYVNGINMFYYDRLSTGIDTIVENNSCGWNFYEPNSCRNKNRILDSIKSADIVKFSNSRIKGSSAECLITSIQEGSGKLIIETRGIEGFRYKVREPNGIFSDWIDVSPSTMPIVVDESGAGDWLTAVFIRLFLNKYPWRVDYIDSIEVEKMFNIAKEIAAYKCNYIGAQYVLSDPKAIEYIECLLGIDVLQLNKSSMNWHDGCYYCGTP